MNARQYDQQLETAAAATGGCPDDDMFGIRACLVEAGLWDIEQDCLDNEALDRLAHSATPS